MSVPPNTLAYPPPTIAHVVDRLGVARALGVIEEAAGGPAERMRLGEEIRAVVSERQGLGHPYLPGLRPTLVTKSATCRSAADAFALSVPGPASRLTGKVYVIQAGTTYTVVDPAYYEKAPGYWSILVFNSNWVLRSR